MTITNDPKTDPIGEMLARMEAKLDSALTEQGNRQSGPHQEGPDTAWNPRAAYLQYRDGLKYAFHGAVRYHRDGLAMLLRLAESEGDELLTEILRKDLDELGAA